MFIVNRTVTDLGAARILQCAISNIRQVVELGKRPLDMSIFQRAFLIAVRIGPNVISHVENLQLSELLHWSSFLINRTWLSVKGESIFPSMLQLCPRSARSVTTPRFAADIHPDLDCSIITKSIVVMP